jgi:DNA-binding GntR family transcriptional regulator
MLDAALAKDVEMACGLLKQHYEKTTESVLRHELLKG